MRRALLVGGTSETETIAQALAGKGFSVLVCTATDMPLRTGTHPAIRRRCGRLSDDGFEKLIRRARIDIVVNAAHPYATEVRRVTRIVAKRLGLAYIEFLRPASNAAASLPGLIRAADHREAAELAAGAGRRILLTIGVNHLAVYVKAARAANRELLARVLPRPESIAACRAAGLSRSQIILSRGVPSAAANLAQIRKHRIDVLVTKESGEAGGIAEKCEAVRRSGCKMVLVRRPEAAVKDCAGTLAELMERVRRVV